MTKKKVLICGASGFIGRNMAEALKQNEDFEVYGTYLNTPLPEDIGIRVIKADLTNKKDVSGAMKGMDIVIQAAATTSGVKEILQKPYYHVTDNALMNSLIFRAAHEYKISHVIFFSCTVMYKSSDTPLKETDFDANQEIFSSYFGVGWTKVYLEKMCEFYARIGNTKYTAIRHSNIYGPHDKFDLERSHVFGATMTKIMAIEDSGGIVVWGSGEEERDLLYVSDLVDVVELAIEKQKGNFELFNVGCGSSFSVNELAEAMAKVLKKNISLQHDLSRPTIKTKLCLNCEKARNLLGWVPKVILNDGIRKTAQWYRRFYDYK